MGDYNDSRSCLSLGDKGNERGEEKHQPQRKFRTGRGHKRILPQRNREHEGKRRNGSPFHFDANGSMQLRFAPKFRGVVEIFGEKLAQIPEVTWSTPKGGYFISLTVPHGCARRVVSLAKEAGVELTPAGATHPYGKDPEDSTIRIAPTFPELQEVEQTAEGVALCVLVAVMERTG